MLEVKYTNIFKKEIKLAEKRGKNLDKLTEVVELLAAGKKVNPRYRDHGLIGNYCHRRECHIEPNWLLVYKIEDEIITFERTGTHSDLFR